MSTKWVATSANISGCGDLIVELEEYDDIVWAFQSFDERPRE